MKKYVVNKLATVCGCIGISIAFIGFCGAIISTITTFAAMATAGTAIMSIALFFMEG